MELKITQLVSILSLLLYLPSPSYSNPEYDDLVHCLSQNSPPFNPISSIIHTPSKHSYSSLLQSTIQNLWFSILEKPKPLAIITPMMDFHVQAAITCCRKHQLPLRIQSGGHDYDGLSYTSAFLFVVLDLANVSPISVNLEVNTGLLTYKWQHIGHKLDEKLFIRVIMEAVAEGRTRTIQAMFNSVFLGTAKQLVELLKESYPELSLKRKQCKEMSWIESVLQFSRYPEGENIDALIDRTPQPKKLFKDASCKDQIPEPLPETALGELWKWCLEEQKLLLFLDLFGDQMNQIPELDLPFPHRQGNLYDILNWEEGKDENTSDSSNFLQCFQLKTNLSISNSSSGVIFTPSSPSYYSILLSSAENLRFTTKSTPKPELIIQPLEKSHIQAAVTCAEESNINIRTRSGGHDYEGLSYVSHIAFILVDLSNLRSIKIDIEKKIAWVDAGATLGELYHAIAEQSQAYGFPAGTCPTVGVGGHFSGGGIGTLCRKYGLAADNIDDARIVDAKGRVLNRKLMGEGPFWAIRGGGGASFGIIFSWKVKLVPVPTTVTVFLIQRSLEQGATKLVHKWQIIGNKFSKDLFIRLVMEAADSASGSSNKTILVSFAAVFLGPREKLLSTMEDNFPELGVAKTDCIEMSWIQSVLYVAGFPFDGSDDVLLDRINRNKTFFKAKSDYVKEPISEEGLEGLWKILLEEESGYMIWTPYGGRMSEIPVSEIPFPHRNGNLYEIQYMVTWEEKEGTNEPVNWIRSLYAYMTPFVSKNPRSSYLNYRDLDLGFNRNKNESYGQASVWGLKYFNSNFKRLAQIKAEFDPSNFFWYEQSIPLLL